MRLYKEVGFIRVGIHVEWNSGFLDVCIDDSKPAKKVKVETVCKNHPKVREKLEQRKITRPCYLYFVK